MDFGYYNVSPSASIALRIDGAIYQVWTRATITRDLSEIAGSFTVECDDIARAIAALPPKLHPIMSPAMLKWGPSVEVLVDGELVLKGWVEDVHPLITGKSVGVSISGRDVVGDLVDCAAAPLGPVEYRNLKLEDFASKICKPFGITVRAEVDTGEPFKKISIDTGETVMSAIEKLTRKRALLVISDGVGGLILTRSGQTRAPADIRLGDNITEARGSFSSKNRFSDVYVKGQIEGAAGKRKAAANLKVSDAPLTAAPAAGDDDKPTGRESRAVSIKGHARDPEVTRYRPTVKQVRTASLLKDAQTQAEWYVNNARGASETVTYVRQGFRAAGALWRPNTMTSVSDPFNAITKDLLVAGVTLEYGAQGSTTQLRITGKEAYDKTMEGEGEKGGSKSGAKSSTKGESSDLDTEATPL